MSGSGGQTTTLNPTTAAVLINGPVINQESLCAAASGHFDTLALGGSSLGNRITGVISDAAGSAAPANGDTRITDTGGQWILSAQETNTGPTTISGGTLQLGNGTQDGALYTDLPHGRHRHALEQRGFGIRSIFQHHGGPIPNQRRRLGDHSGWRSYFRHNQLVLRCHQHRQRRHFGPGAGAAINSSTKITLGNAGVLDVSAVSPWHVADRQDARRHGIVSRQRLVNQQYRLGDPARHARRQFGRHAQLSAALTLGGGTLSYELGANQDLINVTGNNGLNIGSATVGQPLRLQRHEPFGTPGIWPIMAYSGSFGGRLANLTVGNPEFERRVHFQHAAPASST